MPKTFEYQEQLNTLPMTNLNDASENLLQWLEPLITKNELNTTKNSLETFLKMKVQFFIKNLKNTRNKTKGIG